MGETENVEALSAAVTNIVTGQASQADISLVAQNKNAQTAVELLTDSNLEADEGGIEANLEKVAAERAVTAEVKKVTDGNDIQGPRVNADAGLVRDETNPLISNPKTSPASHETPIETNVAPKDLIILPAFLVRVAKVDVALPAFFKQDKAKADEYLKKLEPTLNKRINEKLQKYNADYAKEHPVKATIKTWLNVIPNDIMAMVGNLNDFNKIAKGEGIDVNDKYKRGNISTQTIRSVVASKQNYIGRVFYNGLTSGVDNGIRMVFAASVGSVCGLQGAALTSFVSTASSIMMGASVTQSAIIEGINKGYTDVEAFLYGVAKGGIESLTEKYSIEAILKGGPTIAKTLTKSLAAEGSEGVASNWAGRILDLIWDGDQAELVQRMNQLVEAGYSKSEAFSIIASELVAEDVETFVTEGFAGMFIGGTSMAINYADSFKTSAKIGTEGAQALVDEGVSMGNELAIETQQNGGNAGIVRRAEILQENKRIRAEMYQAGQKGQNEVKRSVEEYLRRVGENGDVEALSTAVSNIVTGQATQADISLVTQSKNAQTAVELLTDSNLEADEDGIEANLAKVSAERTVTDEVKKVTEGNNIQDPRVNTEAELVRDKTDVSTTNEQFKHVVNTETLSPKEAQVYNIVVSNLKRKAEEIGLLDNTFFTTLQKVNLYAPTIHDRNLINREFQRVFEGNTDPIVASWLNSVNSYARTVTNVNAQNKIEGSEDSHSSYENYTYDALIQKHDMSLTLLDFELVRDGNNKLDRDGVIDKGIKNVRLQNNPKNTLKNAYVYIPDVNCDVLVGKRGLSHGLSRNADATALVTTKIGDILKNSIKVNELKPRDNTLGGYILLGIAKDINENYYPVRVVVNSYETAEEIEKLDVLYAINAKKKNQSSNEAELPADAVPPIKGSSNIRVADFLDLVKDIFSDVFTDDVLEKLGVQREQSILSDSLKFCRESYEEDTAESIENSDDTENTVQGIRTDKRNINDITPVEVEQYIDDFENSRLATGAEIDTKLKNNIHTLIRKFKVQILFDTEVPANGTYENGVIRINPKSTKKIENILFHEFTHHIERTGQNYIKFMDAVIKSNVFKEWMQEKGFSSFEELSRHYLAEYNKKIDKINEEHRKKGEKEEKYLDNFGAKREVVADFVGDRLFNKNMPKAINAFVSEMREWGQRIRDWLRKHKILKENTTNGAEREIQKLEELFSKALEKASGQKNNTTSGVQYDLMQFEDGKKFVDVVIDQSLFDGKTLEEQALLARSIIKERFAGKVIGNINKVFVNGNSAEEYSWLRRKRDDVVAEAKMRASTELDNLIDAGRNFRSELDGQYGHIHKDAIGGFKYFDVIFKVSNEYYEGVINITVNSRGLLLKDITKIKNITNDVTASYGENPASSVVSDVQAEQSVTSDTSTANKRLSQLPKTVNTNFSDGQHSITIPTPTKADADTTPQLEKRQGRSGKGDSISSFADNIERSSWLDKDLKERILSDEGIVSYNRIANADTLSDAFDKLENGGAGETSRLTNLAYNKNAQVNETDVAELFILLEQYQAKGDYESAHRVVQELSEIGRRAGRTVQMFSILGRMTPEGMTMYAQRELDEAFEKYTKHKSKKTTEKLKKIGVIYTPIFSYDCTGD